MDYYNAGVSGQNQVKSQYAGRLTSAQQYAAYAAGQNDGAASLAAEKRGVGKVTVYNREAGLVENEYSAALDEGVRGTLHDTARSLGLKVVVDGDTGESGVSGGNGYLDGNGVLHVSAAADDPVDVVRRHEVTHRLQELAPAEYRNYRDYVMRMQGDQTQAILDKQLQYKKASGGKVVLSNEEAMDEIAADYAGRVMTDEATIRQIMQDDRTLGEKLRDIIRTMARKIKEATGRADPTLEEAVRLWNKAYRAAEKNVQKAQGQNKTAREGGEARYSIDPEFQRSIQEWNSEGRPANELFTLGSTGPVLQGLGAIESDIYMNGDKIKKILRSHPEMTLEEIKRIPEILEDPVLILKSLNAKNTKSQYGNARMVLFGAMKAKDGRPIMCVLDLRPVEHGFLMEDMQKVNSAYTKDNNPIRFVSDSEVMHADKKRTISLLRGMGFQMPMSLLRNGSIGSITYSGQRVNLSGVKFSSVVQVQNSGEVKGQNKTAQEGGEAKFSIRRTREMTLAQQLKMFYDGKMASSDALYFGETPATLEVAGLDRLPLAFTIADFRKSTQKKHNIPRRVLKNLQHDMETALFAFADGDRIGILTSDIDGDGKPLLVGVERNAIMDREPVNAIRSVYGLDNPGPWLKNQFNSGKKFIALDEKRADTFLQTYGAYSASVGDSIHSISDSVPQEGGEVKGQNKTAQEGGEARYSIDPEFQRSIQEWNSEGRPANELFTLGSTGPVLQGLGAIESDIYMNGDKIKKILRSHPEMTLEEIKRIPEILEDPVLILKSKGTGKRGDNSRMVLYGAVKAQNMQPVLAVLDLRPHENGFMLADMQKVNSTYTKKNPVSFVTDSDVLFADKKRTVPLLRQFGLTIASRQLLRNGSMGSISYDGDIVKMSGVPFPSVVQTQEGGEVKGKFSLKAPVEETKNLVALHNLTADKLWGDLRLGGFPMPSIAVTKTDIPHTNFGDITLVMDKSTIDPKTDRRNTVYSADAWTPTFPRIEYEADPKVESRISKLYYELARKHGYDIVRPMQEFATDLDDALTRAGGAQAMIDKLKDDTDMMQVYLAATGKEPVQTIMRENVNRMDDDKIRQMDFFTEKLGEDVLNELRPVGDESPMSARKRWIAEYGERLRGVFSDWLRLHDATDQQHQNAMEAFSDMQLIREFALPARKYLKTGPETRETVADTSATRQAIRDKTDQRAYHEWLDELLAGAEKSRGVYNNKEIFTPSGNRRSFQQTHYPATLEGIVKAMAGQNDGNSRNVSGFYGVKSLRAGTAKRFSSIKEMHEYEGRLQHLTEEEAEKINNALSERLSAVMRRVYDTRNHGKYDNEFMELDAIGNILMEAAELKTKTIDSLGKLFAKYQYKLGNDTLAEIRDLLFDIGQMPVNIFEAKPERAVGFDEVLAAVIPEGSDQTLADALRDAGVGQVMNYKAGDDTDRLAKVNSVKGARFSLKEDSAGNALTEEQAEFFKDSKVRDEDGKLLVMYHGTPAAGFTEFRSGSYFTQHKEWADVYQSPSASSISAGKKVTNPDTYAVYLNIKKPFDTRNAAERDIFYNEYYRQWGTGTDLMESGLPDWLDGMDLQEFIEEMGYDYDGLILDEGGVGGYGEEIKSRGLSYVTFSPEQIKNTDNRNPTGSPDIRFSLKGEKISPNMSDKERSNILANKVLTPKQFDTMRLTKIEPSDYAALQKIGRSGAYKILRKVGEQFEVFRDYHNDDIDIEFEFSKGKLRESVNKQENEYQNYAKMLTVFDNVVQQAVGIESHTERYGNMDSNVKTVYVMVSAFQDGDSYVPVLLEVKEFVDETKSSLHVAVSATQIKRSSIVEHTPYSNAEQPYSLTASELSIPALLSSVNAKDERLLKYIPDDFLDEEQRASKARALNAQKAYVSKKNADRFGGEQKNITQDISSSYGETPKSAFLRDVSMESIPQDGGKGKGKNSLKEDAWTVPVNGNGEAELPETLSYRAGKKVSDWGHAMFADDPDSGWGNYRQKVSRGDGDVYAVAHSELTDISELKEEIARRWDADRADGFAEYYGAPIDDYLAELSGAELAEEFDPQDIVDSAAGYDNGELNEWLWNRVLEPGGIAGVKTADGAVVYDEGIIHRVTAEKTAARYSLKEYSAHQLENWKDSKNIVVYQNEIQLKKFIQDAQNGENLNEKMYFGVIPDELAERIYQETGLKINGYNCTLRASEIRKILRTHGSEKSEAPRGQRRITVDDFLTIPEIIQAPDEIRLSSKLFEGKPVVEFIKTKDGKTTVVSYVSEKHHDLTVQTMYASKKRGALPPQQVSKPLPIRPKRTMVQFPPTIYPRTAEKARGKIP